MIPSLRWAGSALLAPLLVATTSLAAAPKTPAKTSEKPKLIVLELAAAGGVEPAIASALSESIAAELDKASYFDVVSSKDVQTLIGLEREKQLLGCSDDAESCLTEIAGALGARFVLNGSVARLGDAYQLTLQVIDSSKAATLGRSTKLAKDLQILRATLPWALAEATGTPPPPPPSRLVPYSLIGGGAALVVTGAVLGLDGFAREREINRELELGMTNRSVLQPVDSYRQAAGTAAMEKSLAAVSLAAGLGLIGLGLYLNPSTPGGEVTAALVPTGTGFALVGGFR